MLVKSYRLIGFDNKLSALQDSTNEIQGGEIGSGHSLMAIVEIEPTELETELTIRQTPFAKLRMHYQLPGQTNTKLEEFTIPYNFMPFDEHAGLLSIFSIRCIIRRHVEKIHLYPKIFLG